MFACCISAVSSNSGKTILTTALLHHFKKSVQPFKIGPDYIDPQFHTMVCNTPSVNLDSFIMTPQQVAWIYAHYATKEVAILEGVMGFYDGEDKGCSAYGVSKLLGVPTVLLLDCRGSYITVSAVLKGLLAYKEDNTIAAVVLNHISSTMHFELIKKILLQDHPEIVVLGWIQKDLPQLSSCHLGLDLKDLTLLEDISTAVLEHIDIDALLELHVKTKPLQTDGYPFTKIAKQNKHLTVVHDNCFSFLYHDNLRFFQEVFEKVTLVSAQKDEPIPQDADVVFLCGGYVETDEAYAHLRDAKRFRSSLQQHAQDKKVYGECAGLLYLGEAVDAKKMSALLPVRFTLESKFQRLGYYYNEAGIKGHSFHYTKPLDESQGFDILSKKPKGKGKVGSWQKGGVFGTYLHTMFRCNTALIERFFLCDTTKP